MGATTTGLANITNNWIISAIPNATTLTTAEEVYLNQLNNAGVNLLQLLLVDNGFQTSYDTTTGPAIVQPNPPNINVPGSAPVQRVNIVDYIKTLYSKNGIDFDTSLRQGLQAAGIEVSTNGDVTVVAPDTEFSVLVKNAQNANTSGSNIPAAFTALGNSFDFGYATSAIDAFIANPANSFSIQMAIDLMNYPIPTTNDTNGLNQFEQIYWGAYYLAQFPLQTTVNSSGQTVISYSSADCETILETLKALAAEKTNISQALAGNTFTTYTANDYQLRTTAVTDLTSIFNGLDAKYNCTASASAQINQQADQNLTSSSSTTGSLNNTLFYLLCGAVIIVCGIVIYRKLHHKNRATGESKVSKPEAKVETPKETTTTTTSE